MAITGIIGIGFVIAHMVGNLKMYLGIVTHEGVRDYDLDIYGEYLRQLLVPIMPEKGTLWLLRLVLIGAVILHVHAAYSLTVLNRKARPVKYQSARDYQVASFASRTMRWTGTLVLLFIFWHLADFTWGWFNPGFEHGEVYRNVDASLSRIPVAILYIVANIALGIHLFHGVWSLFQSMGWNNPRFNQWRRGLATAVATIVVVGNVSFPVMVLAGVVEFDPDAGTAVAGHVVEVNE
jgi:succinate dehydrogenase / fumarate reductase cytochrome b subunit